MSRHVGFPGDRDTFEVTVTDAKLRPTEFGDVIDFQFTTKNGDVLIWTANSITDNFQKGQSYIIKATVKNHIKDDDGVYQTVVLRVMEFVKPQRRPRVSIGMKRGGGRPMAKTGGMRSKMGRRR